MNMTPQLKETQQIINQISKSLKECADSMTQNYLQKTKEKLLEYADQLQKAGDQIEQAVNFTYFGQKNGGQRKTARKTLAVRENGKKGGRPSSKILTAIAKSEDGLFYTVTFNDGSAKKVNGTNIQAVRDAFPITRYRWDEPMENLYQKLMQ